MKRIWKFYINNGSVATKERDTTIKVPKSAFGVRFMSAGLDGMEKLCVWVMVDDCSNPQIPEKKDKLEEIQVRVRETGRQCDDVIGWQLIDSVHEHYNVYHLFVKTSSKVRLK